MGPSGRQREGLSRDHNPSRVRKPASSAPSRVRSGSLRERPELGGRESRPKIDSSKKYLPSAANTFFPYVKSVWEFAHVRARASVFEWVEKSA